jgi:ATP-binding cassette, subfamily B, bacterial
MSTHLPEDDIFTGKIELALWRKILLFARPYRRELLQLSTIAAICALCDVSFPYFAARVIDIITRADSHESPYRYCGFYLLSVAVLVTCIFAFIVIAGRIATGVSYDLREASFAKLQVLPFSYYDKKAVGWLMSRLTGDCSSLSNVLAWSMLDIVWGTSFLTMATIAMFWFNWKLALTVLAITPAVLIVCRFFQVRILLASRATRKANSQLTAGFNEAVVGVRTTKSMVREEQNLQEFSHLTQALYTHSLQNALYSALFLPLLLSLCSVGVALSLWRGGIDVRSGVISLGVLVAFFQYANMISNPVQELANRLTNIQGAQASAERIQQLLDTPLEIEDSAEVKRRIESLNHRIIGSLETAPVPSSNDSMIQCSDDSISRESIAIDGYPARIETIEFRDVSFEYKANQPVLRNFNLTVRQGESIALVGPTGGGKSTIVSLTCRFYEPTSGQILINGIDYRQRSLSWLQSQLGMVLQQPHLFSGTIRENIRYGRLTATDAEIEEAATLVNAHPFIAQLEKGYESPVGEGGNQLSTGQKQLIALARAVLVNPQIFVMDEATSSVDTQTERAIQAAVDRILKKQISFVIAHRLSTIRSADRILVISEGKIMEEGNHHELIRRRGKYYELYTNQFTQEHEEEVLGATQ